MINDYKISSLSFTLMFICIINALLPGTLFPYMIYEAKTSVFISILINYFIGLVMILLFIKLFNYLPSESIFGKIKKIFPNIIAKIIGTFILFLIFIFAICVFWRYSTFISLEFLTETPNVFVTLIIILPIIYIMFYDIDTIARVSVFCTFIGFILFLNNFISLFGMVDLSNFKPLLNNDLSHIVKSSLVFVTLNVVPILSLLIIPKNNVLDNEKLPKNLIIGYTINTICICGIFFVIIGVMGIELSSLFTFPSYEVLKTINMFSFLDNIENLNISIWILFMTFSVSYNMLILKYGIKEIFNIKNKRVIFILCALIIVLLASVVIFIIPYENYINKYKRLYTYVPFALLLTSIVSIIFIYVSGKIKFRKQEKKLKTLNIEKPAN